MEDNDRLRNYQELLAEKYDFKPGDIIKWKKGLRNRTRPEPRQRAVVIEIMKRNESHVNEAGEAGSAYFKEILDLRLGFIDDDDDFVMFWVDSERFELVD